MDQGALKLFLDKWDGQTSVVPALPGSGFQAAALR